MKALLSIGMAVVLSMGCFAQDQNSVSYFAPSWSPDGKWIAFTKMDITQSKPMKIDADVYVVKPDGTALRKVTGEGANEFAPVFTRDGKMLVFGRIDPATKAGSIYSVGLDGTKPKQLTQLNGAAAPQFTRDGKWIAFNANLTSDPKDHFPQIYVMKADGTGVKQLTNDGALAFYNPVWSPDGRRIVYYVERGDNRDQIWSMNADGTGATLLTANVAHNFYPSWSADGRRIIFTSVREGKPGELYSMNADGTGLTATGIETSWARQSPDGKKLLYIGGRFPNMQLFVADADGSKAVKISQ